MENNIEEIYINSTSKYECLKYFIELVINDINSAIYNEDIELFNEINNFIKDKIEYLDEVENINEKEEMINKYRILKDIIEKIFNFDNIDINIYYLKEILNE